MPEGGLLQQLPETRVSVLKHVVEQSLTGPPPIEPLDQPFPHHLVVGLRDQDLHPRREECLLVLSGAGGAAEQVVEAILNAPDILGEERCHGLTGTAFRTSVK